MVKLAWCMAAKTSSGLPPLSTISCFICKAIFIRPSKLPAVFNTFTICLTRA